MTESPLTAKAVRNAFTEFFIERDHEKVQSASLIPHDKTLLFTNSGMVQFKPFLTGEQTAPWKRAVTVQKCVRAGGKHNDLDEVGRTTRHLTFFEMMGNFSFGDYFKSDACFFAWEFITKNLGLDPGRLWVTVHLTDDEAESIWLNEVGVSPERIQRLDEDNFWKMADTGPCGPSSEIFWDKGLEFGPDGGPAHGGEERFVEIWNLVFMQYDQHPDGSMTDLPAPSIDTGSGLERILTVLQDADSIWETEELARLIKVIGSLISVDYGENERTDVSMRILADHARSSTFLISDGVFPSNEDRGYVLRRIIRRAVRHAWLLGLEDSVMSILSSSVIEIMGDDYPELEQNKDFIKDVLDREENRFSETLRSGLVILDEAISELEENGFLDGAIAFKLHDTYGFPLELTEEICSERMVGIDKNSFDSAMAVQQERARSARKETIGENVNGSLRSVFDKNGPTEFVGRERTESNSVVLYFDEKVLILDKTPFYAESGGQIGDTGLIESVKSKIMITDTTLALESLHVHHYEIIEGDLEVGQSVDAKIDVEKRASVMRNHTATHLLHWALREILGDHVKQQGSYVGSGRLRFDFSHFEALTEGQLFAVEDLVNEEIISNHECRHNEMTRDEAEKLGAVAFFGDKYGETVRVLEAGPNSLEFCGGTHVSALGDIGLVKIINEGSIGSNIRRIEAITGKTSIDKLRMAERSLTEIADLVGVTTDDLLEGVKRKMEDLKSLRNEVDNLKRLSALNMVGDLVSASEDGLVVVHVDGIERDSLKDLAVAVLDHKEIQVVILGVTPSDGGVALVAAVKIENGFDAGVILAEASKTIGGGGRPNPELTLVGGKFPDKLGKALEQAKAVAVSNRKT